MTPPEGKDPYPDGPAERSSWIQELRPVRPHVPEGPAGAFVEEEPAPAGGSVRVSTLLLAGAECPWRCLMCDLWKQTSRGPTPPGALPTQVDAGLASIDRPSHAEAPRRDEWLKLYNAGSFFDRAAVPPVDLPALAARGSRFDRLIVECHPSLVGSSAVRFRGLLDSTALEVAMGLETVHPGVLPRLNKRMTAADFSRAAAYLVREGIDVRAFVLAGLPFVSRDESVHWAKRSIEFAFDSGASVVAVIPTRAGNGAMERLGRDGLFTPPDLAMLEEVSAHGLRLGAGRLLVDTWDLGSLGTCSACATARAERLAAQNLRQAVPPVMPCLRCRG